MVIYTRNQEQKEMVLKFLKENGIGYQESSTYYDRKSFQHRRKLLEKELAKYLKKYLPTFQKELKKVPDCIEIRAFKGKPVQVTVLDKQGNKMLLREHGDFVRLRAIWLDVIKKFVEVEELHDVKTSVFLNEGSWGKEDGDNRKSSVS